VVVQVAVHRVAALVEAVAVAGKLDLWDKKIEKHTIKMILTLYF
jgi:hypothetical protein